MPPRSIETPYLLRLNEAAETLLSSLYSTPREPVTAKNDPKPERNSQIQTLYAQGLSIPELAQQFGLSHARVHQILHGRSR